MKKYLAHGVVIFALAIIAPAMIITHNNSAAGDKQDVAHPSSVTSVPAENLPLPVPGFWILGSGLLGLIGQKRFE